MKVQSSSNINASQPNSNWNSLPAGSLKSIEVKKGKCTTPNSKWKVGYASNMNDRMIFKYKFI